MKKFFLALAFAAIFSGLSMIAFAQEPKVITLKDGSALKGNVIQLEDGIYTIETSNLGRINIPEDNILSIVSAQAVASQQAEDGSSEKAQLKNQVQEIQGSILSDPGLMVEIQNILSDKEVQAMLSDPKLLDDMLSYDAEKIQQNENVQSLMQNPKMQGLINKINQKIPAQE